MRTKLLFVAFLGAIQFSFAQKNAPVAGDAAKLIDFLRKDYNAIDPNSKSDELSRDMSRVTAIFKSYLYNEQINLIVEAVDNQDSIKENLNKNYKKGPVYIGDKSIDISDLCGKLSDVDKEFTEYISSKNKYESSKYQEEDKDFNREKKEYFDLKFYADINDLEFIKKAYVNGEESLKNEYLGNVIDAFISKYNVVKKNTTDFTAQINYNSSIQKGLPFLGGDLAFETAIDGLSRFLAKRIKEELTTHAIQKIQNYLNNPGTKSYLNELMVLLPITTDYLKSFDANQILNFTDDFKQYIEKDLNHLIANTANLKGTPRFKLLIENNPDIGFAFEALELIPNISKLKEPLDYFELLANSENLQKWSSEENVNKYNIANSIKFTTMLAHSLLIIDDRGKQKIVSLDFMSDYGAEKDFFLLFVGFLHQQNIKYYNVSFKNEIKVDSVDLRLDYLMSKLTPETIKSTDETFLLIKNKLFAIAEHTEKLQTEIDKLKKTAVRDDKVEIANVYNFTNTLLNFSEEIAQTTDTILKQGKALFFFDKELSDKDITEKTKPYFKTAHTVNDIFLDLHQKNFTTAIISALEIPSNFSNNNLSLDKLVSLGDVLKSSNNIKMIKELNTYNSIPISKSKRENIKVLITNLDYVIQQSKSSELKKLKSVIKKMHDGIVQNKDDFDFKNELKSFNKELSSHLVEVLTEYVKVDVTKDFKTPIDSLIKNLSIEEKRKEALIDCFDSYINSAFKDVLGLEDSSLEENKKNLIREFTVYLPSLTKNVFRVKDDNLLRVIHFITDVAVSENAEDVEAALNSFALPAGSSSLKEYASSYFSINSYPGVLFGNEIKLTETTAVENANHIGLTAPVGVYAHIKTTQKKYSWGLFFPIIDIAAPVRFRLDDDNGTESLPDFNFKDIFSPGMYVSCGWPNSPFSLNMGVQYGPKLRGIEEGEGEFVDVESLRVGVGLVIDIPLFTVYNKTKN